MIDVQVHRSFLLVISIDPVIPILLLIGAGTHLDVLGCSNIELNLTINGLIVTVAISTRGWKLVECLTVDSGQSGNSPLTSWSVIVWWVFVIVLVSTITIITLRPMTTVACWGAYTCIVVSIASSKEWLRGIHTRISLVAFR